MRVNNMALSGTIRFARYAFMPNKLGYCGGNDNRTLFEYCAAQHTDPGLTIILQKFEAAYPYLKLIANSNGIPDPFDTRVVEAYWLGNSLLDRVDLSNFYNSLNELFTKRLDSKTLGQIFSRPPLGARPNHSFHVFNVHSRIGALDHSLDTMENCRIGWGQIKEISGTRFIVEHQPLILKEGKLKLGALKPKTVMCQLNGKGFVANFKVGDFVSFHWGWACEILSPGQVQYLERYTRYHLDLTNRTATL